MEYKIESGSHQFALMEAVMSSIKLGWSPCGGVCVVYHPIYRTCEYYQAMVYQVPTI